MSIEAEVETVFITQKEYEVFCLLIEQGASLSEAASHMHIDRRTCETHLYSLRGKLGVGYRDSSLRLRPMFEQKRVVVSHGKKQKILDAIEVLRLKNEHPAMEHKAIAAKVGISVSTVQNYLSGIGLPKYEIANDPKKPVELTASIKSDQEDTQQTQAFTYNLVPFTC